MSYANSVNIATQHGVEDKETEEKHRDIDGSEWCVCELGCISGTLTEMNSVDVSSGVSQGL